MEKIRSVIYLWLLLLVSTEAWAGQNQRETLFIRRDVRKPCTKWSNGRCLERLDRENGSPDQAVENLSPKSGNFLGIQTKEYLSKGWIQKDFPKYFYDPPQTYSYRDLAISRSYCKKLVNKKGDFEDYPGWLFARDSCKEKGYQAVRVYAQLDRTDNIPKMVEHDPWYKNFRENVKIIAVSDLAELKRKIAKIVMDCNIIEFIFIDSHGSRNINKKKKEVSSVDIVFTAKESEYSSDYSYRVGRILETGISLCSLAPNAKLQFAGCNLGCKKAAQNIEGDLFDILDDSGLKNSKKHKFPFNNISMLFNTNFGSIADLEGTKTFVQNYFGPDSIPVEFNFNVYSYNDIAVIFSIDRNGEISTDIPVGSLPECEVGD